MLSDISHYLFSEDLIVGFITFEMILSIMPPKLKPHLTKLAAFVAHGLEVDTSQVVSLSVAIILLSNVSVHI